MFSEDDLGSRTIAAGLEVHRALGPGFIESIYHRAFLRALERHKIPHKSEVGVPVFFDGIEVGAHRLDLLVGGRIVVELKATAGIDAQHFAVVRSYLRATGASHGLILNFAKVRLEVRRVFADAHRTRDRRKLLDAGTG